MKNRYLIIVLQLFVITASAQEIVRPIRLKSGLVTGTRNLRNALHIADSLKPVHYKDRFYTLIQFALVPDMATRQSLAKEGILLFDYIPDNTFLAEVSERFDPLQFKKDIISGVFTLDPKNKISAKLQKQLQQPVPDPDKLIAVSFYGNIDRNTVIAELTRAGAQIADTKIQPDHVVFIKAPATVVQKLATLPFVAWISSQQMKNVPLNYFARGAHGITGLSAATGRNLQGSNVTLGIGDNGEISSHVDFTGRLINRNPAGPADHGIHTAGTMAGAGLKDPYYQGMAPKATIIGQFYSDILVNAPYFMDDFDMVLTNNSYHAAEGGCSGEGEYDVLSNYVDAQLNARPQLLHVFAAGNDGRLTCSPYPLMYNTVKSGFQCGKNVLTVGAVGSTYIIADFSSSGPVADGRLKPEIVANGAPVASTTVNNSYIGHYGTSQAAPVVTGTLGLLYERYRQLHGGADPSAALIKAVTCNSAEDFGNPGPDFVYGFGYLNARKAVEAIENNTYFTNGTGQGGTVIHTITGVPAGMAQLKVMLYWNDPAAAPYAATTLVNNLDITVTVPGGAVHYPLVLNPAPGSVNIAATESVDSRNNIEQVTINAPAAGDYTITVKGTGVPIGPQDYVVVYEWTPPSVTLEYPAGEETWVPGNRERIRWSAPPANTNTFTIEYSIDSGSTWNMIDNNVPASSRSYEAWFVPNSPTNTGLVRISMNSTGYSDVCDHNITILQQPEIIASAVCPGYASLSWDAISSATSYEVMMIKGSEMKTIGTTNTTSYVVEGLNKDSTYWFSVRPMINTSPGRRAIAVSFTPSGGDCSATLFQHDLSADLLVAPVTGRQFTASALGAVAPQIRIKNNGSVPSSGSFDITYQVNGGTPVTENSSVIIAANTTYTHTFTGTYDFSVPGTYTVKAWITYTNDPLHANDTIVSVVKQLQNTAITLSPLFTEDFESAAPKAYINGARGFDGLDRCDFYSNNSNGRARTFVNSGMARSGNRAATLDQTVYTGTPSVDSLITTFNLGSYTPADQIWLSFYYQNQGTDYFASGNRVWIRGDENSAWIPVTTLSYSAGSIGKYLKAPPVNITETLANAVPAQTVSPSFQIKFGEHGYTSTNSVIPDGNLDDGYTYDDITLTLTSNDIGVLRLVAPLLNNSCALGAVEPITVQVKNYSSATMTNVPVYYDINGATVHETIGTINPGEVLNYQFGTKADLSAFKEYTLTAWVDYAIDDYATNDTISTTFHTTPYVTSYPYIESFETSDGGWYTGGINSSWQWGTPEGTIINKAANGTKAWVTDTAGNYNMNEISYLYSPCFNLSGLSQPVLSFSHIFRTEDGCNCDLHWIDFSTDGVNWVPLGEAGSGTNWFDNPLLQVWQLSSTRWHVSSIGIPTKATKVRFRFGMYSDVAVSYEGVGIDDIHIFDKGEAAIYSGPDITGGLSQPVSGSNWIHFDSGGDHVVSINPNGQDLGNTDVKVYINTGSVRNDGAQYYLDRNIVIQPTNTPTAPVTVRYYFLDDEANKLINATGCSNCSTIADAYAAGITQYSNALPEENGTLSDNNNGTYNFITPADVTVMPYDSGYYAEYQVSNFSEFWINSGGPAFDKPLPLVLGQFTATRDKNTGVLNWTTQQESNTSSFFIEKSDDGVHYTVIGTLPAAGNSAIPKQYQFIDKQLLNGKNHYRLKMTDRDGKFVYSPVRTINNNDVDFTVTLHPNPVTKGIVYINTSAACKRLELRDVAGRLLKTANTKGTQNELQVNDVSKGVYFLTIYTEAGKKIEKVFVE